MKKRIFALLTALVLLLTGILSSCGKNGGKGNETTAPEGTGDLTIPFMENGECGYTIVFPDTTSPDLMTAVVNMKTAIRKLTGARLEMLSESTAIEERRTAKMILIGRTAFEESVTALEQLPETCSDEYIVTVQYDSIVVNSHFDTALAEAVKTFAEQLVSYNEETGNLTVRTLVNPGTVQLPSNFDPGSLGVYSIVYPAQPLGLQALALSLHDAIQTATGNDLPVYLDTAASSESVFEILVGNTNRTLSKKCYAEASSIMHYEIVAENGKLQLMIGGPYSGMKCVEKFTARILEKKEKLDNGSYYATDLATDSQPLTTGADIRVMSSNVLAYQWGEAKYSNLYPVSTRCEIYAGVLLRFRPDFVGVQEADEPWSKALPYYLKVMAEKDHVVYTELVGRVSHLGKSVVNFSPILYRSDLYQADESGCKVFEANYQESYCQRVGTYAKFTSRTDPTRQLILVNTHWAHETEESILSCINEEAALVQQLETKYPNVPVFCTGDFNSDYRKPPTDEPTNPRNRYEFFQQFVNQISGTIASDAARTKGVLITPGGCRASANKMGESVERAIDYDFIDHIVVSGGYADVLRHDTIRSNGCHVMSDHSPIYADFSLKEPS